MTYVYVIFLYVCLMCAIVYMQEFVYTIIFFFLVVSEIILLDTHFFSFFRLFS